MTGEAIKAHAKMISDIVEVLRGADTAGMSPMQMAKTLIDMEEARAMLARVRERIPFVTGDSGPLFR